MHLGANVHEAIEPVEVLESRRDTTRLLLDDVIALELLVSYVHAEHYRLQQLSRENILFRREYSWSPFDSRLKEVQTFYKR